MAQKHEGLLVFEDTQHCYFIWMNTPCLFICDKYYLNWWCDFQAVRCQRLQALSKYIQSTENVFVSICIQNQVFLFSCANVSYFIILSLIIPLYLCVYRQHIIGAFELLHNESLW